jgi:beta-1,2-mannobiose phosphorylase / 1,2-beta-oligomannan phosphorylase
VVAIGSTADTTPDWSTSTRSERIALTDSGSELPPSFTTLWAVTNFVFCAPPHRNDPIPRVPLAVPPRRANENPILTPAMVPPSRPELEVAGVFNPAVIRHRADVLLLLRVAEAAPPTSARELTAPMYNASSGRLEVRRWRRDAEGLDASDPRVVTVHGRTWLTSISHFRVARSTDGIRFEVEPTPALSSVTAYESFGVEDPRITFVDGTYWINYTAVSPHGISTALASTSDFRTFRRHGIIFPPNNRDVTIFPERIDGHYAALHRPMPESIGQPAIWVATSSDMVSWGSHRLVASARDGSWDDAKVGGGAVPLRVRVGSTEAWLVIYHGVTSSPLTYSLGALLLDAHDPGRVIARSREPILSPEAPYECDGFFGRVVFTCGLVADGDLLRIYYGAADCVTAVADLSLDEILAGMS